MESGNPNTTKVIEIETPKEFMHELVVMVLSSKVVWDIISGRPAFPIHRLIASMAMHAWLETNVSSAGWQLATGNWQLATGNWPNGLQ